MNIIPAIDLMEGGVVRLVEGKPDSRIIYDSLKDPFSTLEYFLSCGVKLVHVVDLDAALGNKDNINIIQKMVREYDVDIQYGGGIRSINLARKLLELGVYRVILGTLAIVSIDSITTLLSEYGDERIMIALDYGLDGYIRYKGWRAKSEMKLNKAIKFFKEHGCRNFLLTCIDRDGTLEGVDRRYIPKVISEADIYVAGGISSVEDIKFLMDVGASGVVIGRALYEGKLDLNDLLELVNNAG